MSRFYNISHGHYQGTLQTPGELYSPSEIETSEHLYHAQSTTTIYGNLLLEGPAGVGPARGYLLRPAEVKNV